MKKNDFEYQYSALSEDEKQEIENIRKKHEESCVNVGLKKLRVLHKKVKFTPIIFASCLGVLSLLVFGLGLAMVLVWQLYVWGSIVGVFGLFGCLITYPFYRILHIRIKTKYSDEIIEISHNILDEKVKDSENSLF